MRHRVAFGTDDRNECVTAVLEYLRSVADVEVVEAGDSWPEFSRLVGEKVAGGEADFGVLMCWTGTGTAIAANKVTGVRAAQAWDPWIAESARRWNDANVLALSLRTTSRAQLEEILDAWFASATSDEADDRANVEHLAKLESGE